MISQKLAASALVLLSDATMAMAQTEPSTSSADTVQTGEQVAEIVVTAQKRSENLQNVPISVAAITNAQIQAAGIINTRDLSVVTPGLNITSSVGYLLPNLRGIGSTTTAPGLSNAVAVYVDGVYYAAQTASLLTLNNIAQIEVLKGPQGTLFGRNATGGLIQVTTLTPSERLGGRASVSYGNYQTLQSRLYVTGGLAPNLAADFAVQYARQGRGYGRNLNTGAEVAKIYHDYGLRSKLHYDGGGTVVTLSGDYSNTLDSANSANRLYPGNSALFGPSRIGNRYDVDHNLEPRIGTRGGGGSLRIDHEFGSLKLASITAYRKSRYNLRLDPDATAVEALNLPQLLEHDRQFTQEVQLLSRQDGRFNWVLGAFYISSAANSSPYTLDLLGPAINPAFPLTELVTVSQENVRSIAGYGQGTLKIGDATRLTLGGRYTSERHELNATQNATLVGGIDIGLITNIQGAKLHFNRPTWRVSLDHDLAQQVLGYVSYNRGFKSGGFNTSSPADPPYRPETIDAYEAGIKTTLFDRRVRLNGAAFFYDYRNIQVPRFVLATISIVNGARAHFYGFDLDGEVVATERLHFTGGIALLHARFTSFPDAVINTPSPTGGNVQTAGDVSGNDVANAPTMTLSLGTDYRIPVGNGSVVLNGTYYHNGGYFPEADNIQRQRHYNLVSASVTWNAPDDRWYVRVWGRNLTDAAYTNQISSSLPATTATYAPPRTYGLEIGGKF